jgi:glycosyltransferase involved in cell wall biosynthesis
LEALHSGIPVISSDAGCFQEFGESLYFYAADSQAELIDRLNSWESLQPKPVVHLKENPVDALMQVYRSVL